MNTYNVCTVDLPDLHHHRAFEETANCLTVCLGDLGHTAYRSNSTLSPPGHTTIVLAAHLLRWRPDSQLLTPGTIVYNLEQLGGGAMWSTEVTERLIRYAPGLTLWDYCGHNVSLWAKRGIQAKLLPIGWHERLDRFRPKPWAERDIDVLFVGALVPRRRAVIDRLLEEGANVESRFGVYGAERDELYARAKIVLNMHQFDAKVFESVRCAYLLANGCTVVSELSSNQYEADEWSAGISFCSYDQLVDRCLELLEKPAAILGLGDEAIEVIRRRKFVDGLSKLV